MGGTGSLRSAFPARRIPGTRDRTATVPYRKRDVAVAERFGRNLRRERRRVDLSQEGLAKLAGLCSSTASTGSRHPSRSARSPSRSDSIH
jgi:hypothetical protein